MLSHAKKGVSFENVAIDIIWLHDDKISCILERHLVFALQ
jgi:hypothetical protein